MTAPTKYNGICQVNTQLIGYGKGGFEFADGDMSLMFYDAYYNNKCQITYLVDVKLLENNISLHSNNLTIYTDLGVIIMLGLVIILFMCCRIMYSCRLRKKIRYSANSL